MTKQRDIRMINMLWLALAVALTVSFFLIKADEKTPITNFDECAEAGNPILEIYPAQCVTQDGQFFREEIGFSDDTAPPDFELSSQYAGLTENEGAELASEQGRSFRVIESDGDPQAITLDIQDGRINATLTDGVITDIEVEHAFDAI